MSLLVLALFAKLPMSPQLLERESGGGGCNYDVSRIDVLRPTFYVRTGKRALDILGASLGLIVLSPLFAVAAFLIPLTSRGPIFYRQARQGKDGSTFQIVKFRSMVTDAEAGGSRITISRDNRVTALGKFLRRSKVDELPQLWNVLRGEMSLVGPRPELPEYVALYTRQQRAVLQVRPGITDPASLAYRNEEEILGAQTNPEEFYRTRILPDKLARNIAYLQRISLAQDLRLIVETLVSALFFAGRAE
jgi:lipopolysaccharide/colanic/teichoic acid biosynthesis glycosyltransferase